MPIAISIREKAARDDYVKKNQADIDAFVATLPDLLVTLGELQRLNEYSCSLPTGTTPGKRWKNHHGAFTPGFVSNGGKARWIIGEYDPDGDPKAEEIKINWYRPVIRVKAVGVPAMIYQEDHA